MISRPLTLGRFCGTSLRRRQTPGACVTKNRFAPHLRIAEHAHDTAHFTFVQSGSYLECYESATVECVPGLVLWVPAHTAHSDEVSGAGASTVSLEFRAETLLMMQSYVPIPTAPQVVLRSRVRPLVRRLLEEFELGDEASLLVIDGLAVELVAVAFRPLELATVHESGKWLMRVKEQLDYEFVCPPTLPALALEASVDPGHLTRAFRSHFGVSIGEYVRLRRIENACERLERTDETLGSIAADLGFYDQAHFTRVFRELRGSTPGEYRRRFR